MKNEIHEQNIRIDFLSKCKDLFFNIENKFRIIFKSLKIFILVVLVLAILGEANFIYLENRSMWQDKLVGTDLEGSFERVFLANKLQGVFDNYLAKKTLIKVDNNSYYLTNRNLGINFNLEKTHQKFFKENKNLSYFEKYFSRLTKVYAGENILADVEVNQAILKKTLFSLIPELQNQAIEAKIILAKNEFIIIPEQTGVTFDSDKLAYQLKLNATNFESIPLEIYTKEAIPKIKTEDAKKALENFYKISEKIIILKSDNPLIKKELDLKTDLSQFRISRIYNPLSEKPELHFDLDPTTLIDYLKKEVIPNIDRESKNITLSITNELEINTAGEIQDGRSVNIDETIALIQESLKSDIQKNEIPISITQIPGKIIQPKEVDTGIHELVGYGESSFIGSPLNRRHNIAVAMNRFKNIIVMPGEIFSFNRYLGAVNGETGYKKELVIKEGGNLTIPEYGGGVCQVSTTIFRAALYGGFEIIERHNHSYKVAYYNPDGLDASIYPPRVDFRFKNNTKYPILIQNELDEKSSKAYFRIYGTKNYQEVKMDGPYIYAYQPKPKTAITNYVKSESPTFYQEKKGHSGFKVYWIRKIIGLDSLSKEEKFYSSYKPIPDTINIGGEAPAPIPITE